MKGYWQARGQVELGHGQLWDRTGTVSCFQRKEHHELYGGGVIQQDRWFTYGRAGGGGGEADELAIA